MGAGRVRYYWTRLIVPVQSPDSVSAHLKAGIVITATIIMISESTAQVCIMIH